MAGGWAGGNRKGYGGKGGLAASRGMEVAGREDGRAWLAFMKGIERYGRCVSGGAARLRSPMGRDMHGAAQGTPCKILEIRRGYGERGGHPVPFFIEF